MQSQQNDGQKAFNKGWVAWEKAQKTKEIIEKEIHNNEIYDFWQGYYLSHANPEDCGTD